MFLVGNGHRLLGALRGIFNRKMLAPENKALAVGAAQNLLTALQFNERLRRHGNVAAGADAFLPGNNDGVLKTPADEFIAHEHGLRNILAG